MLTLFTNGLILRDHELQKQDLWVQDGIICAPQTKADIEIDASDKILSPGFIDLQINGCYGVDFLNSPELWENAAAKLYANGVTGFLATLISSPGDNYHAILASLTPKNSLLGVHLEGPLLNPKYAGAHERRNFDHYEGPLENVKMVTLAPEMEGAEKLIHDLTKKGIVVSAGHTDISYDQMKNISDIKAVTHLFNTMRPFHHRDVGLIGYALNNNLAYSIIADGVHVHPPAVKMAWRANPQGLFLISDAVASAGMPAGRYTLGNQILQKNNSHTHLEHKDTLAGSTTFLDICVRNFFSWTGCTIAEALEAASAKPAKLIGLYPKKGSLAIGSDADILILDKNLNVTATFQGGERKF